MTLTRSSSRGLEPLLKQARFNGTKVVVSRGVRILTAEEEHPVSGRQLPSAIDQHAWLDPRNGVIYVRNIAEALSHLDPANAADYRARAAAYTTELQVLDEWARKGNHGSASRKAASAGVARFAAVHRECLRHHAASGNGWTNKNEPSAGGLARLARQIRTEHVKALFLDSITDPRTMQHIAGETGAVIGGTLYGDSLSPAPGEADTYLKMLRHDVSVLRAGMMAN